MVEKPELFINQRVPGLTDSWSSILKYSLSFDGKEFFGDAVKLRVFSVNCFESYQEYGIINTYSINELRSVLFYFGKQYEEERSAPTGKELQFIHLLLEKIKDHFLSAGKSKSQQ